jgi:hypothetical protein
LPLPSVRLRASGVMATGTQRLVSCWPIFPAARHNNLFDECAPRPDSEALMNAVDRINRAGKGRIFFLPARGINVGFAMRREMLSPEYDRLERLAACFHEISDIWIL